jgi:hypothetical protein
MTECSDWPRPELRHTADELWSPYLDDGDLGALGFDGGGDAGAGFVAGTVPRVSRLGIRMPSWQR